jgi:hypothetical protein
MLPATQSVRNAVRIMVVSSLKALHDPAPIGAVQLIKSAADKALELN